MSKISYPAVFHKDGNSYSVTFPDLEGCLTNGKTIEVAFENAKEVLGLYLDQNDDKAIKNPSNFAEIISKNTDSIVMLVEYDSTEYSKKNKSKAVKKTLSIPEWLNEMAIRENINFSSVLQEALIQKLRIR